MAMTNAGLDPDMIFNDCFLDEKGGYLATVEMMKSYKPDAILYASDILAYGGMSYLRREKLSFPDDLGIMGFDNAALSETFGLTTMSEMIEDTAHLVLENLLGMIENKTIYAPKEINLTPQLIIRDSLREPSSWCSVR